MNNKQKFGYTGLGALIMLIGIGVGSVVSPPLIAQRNGVFNEITCRKLTVVDEAGNKAIYLTSTKEANGVFVANQASQLAISLASSGEMGNAVFVHDKLGKVAMRLSSTDGSGNSIMLFDKLQQPVIELAGQTTNYSYMHNLYQSFMYGDQGGAQLIVSDKDGKTIIDERGMAIYANETASPSIEIVRGKHANQVAVSDVEDKKQVMKRASLFVGNSASVNVSDKELGFNWVVDSAKRR